jgi:hypothetical protein
MIMVIFVLPHCSGSVVYDLSYEMQILLDVFIDAYVIQQTCDTPKSNIL